MDYKFWIDTTATVITPPLTSAKSLKSPKSPTTAYGFNQVPSEIIRMIGFEYVGDINDITNLMNVNTLFEKHLSLFTKNQKFRQINSFFWQRYFERRMFNADIAFCKTKDSNELSQFTNLLFGKECLNKNSNDKNVYYKKMSYVWENIQSANVWRHHLLQYMPPKTLKNFPKGNHSICSFFLYFSFFYFLFFYFLFFLFFFIFFFVCFFFAVSILSFLTVHIQKGVCNFCFFLTIFLMCQP